MPVELYARDGALLAEIPDWRGELFGYRVERLPGLPVRYHLRKEGADDQDPYLVTLQGDAWACTCRAYEFRNTRTRQTHRGTCKHCEAVRESIHPAVEAILRQLLGDTSA